MGLIQQFRRHAQAHGRRQLQAAKQLIWSPKGDQSIENPFQTKNVYCPGCHCSRSLPTNLMVGQAFTLGVCKICLTSLSGVFYGDRVTLEY